MNSRFCLIFLIFIFTFCLFPNAVFSVLDNAVGVIDIGQKAMIFYEDGKEILIVSATFQGTAKKFAWIIPAPSKPEIEKLSDEIFISLETLTALRGEEGLLLLPPFPINGVTPPSIKAPIKISKTQGVEIRHLNTFTLEKKEGISTWLTEYGYKFPEKLNYLLEDYIKNGWYFNTFEINLENWQINQGHTFPIKLEFSTEKIVYPLRLSWVKITQEEVLAKGELNETMEGFKLREKIQKSIVQTPTSIPVIIYSIDQHKKALPGFTPEYAGWVSKGAIERLVAGEKVIESKKDEYFLTKLTRVIDFKDIVSDLYLEDAPDDKTINAPVKEASRIFWWVMIAALIISGVIIFYVIKEVFTKGRKP